LYREFVEYALRSYKRIHRVSLVLDEYNLRRAFDVYRIAIVDGLTRYAAVVRYFGYQHRRMENFLEEIGVWSYGMWVHVQTIIKCKAFYVRTTKPRGVEITMDFEYRTIRPLCTVRVNKAIMWRTFMEFCDSFPSELSIPCTFLRIRNWEYDDVGYTFHGPHDLQVETELKAYIDDGKGHMYLETGDAVENKYTAYGLMVRGQEPRIEIKRVVEEKVYAAPAPI